MANDVRVVVHKIGELHSWQHFDSKDLLNTVFELAESDVLPIFDIDHPDTARSLFSFFKSID